MKILITGGAGFIGSHAIETLQASGHQLSVVDNLSTGKAENVPPGVPLHRADILDSSRLGEIVSQERPEVVIHLAAQTSVAVSMRWPRQDARTNIEGSIEVLEACRQNRVRKVIYASSAAVFGMPEYLPIDEQHACRPLSAYGVSKHTVEHYLEMYRHSYGLAYTVLRFGNIYGERQDPLGEAGVIAIFADALQNGKEIIIHGDGEQTRDFIYVRDAARALMPALTAGDNEIINIGTGQGSSINRLLETMQSAVIQMASSPGVRARTASIQTASVQASTAAVAASTANAEALATPEAAAAFGAADVVVKPATATVTAAAALGAAAKIAATAAVAPACAVRYVLARPADIRHSLIDSSKAVRVLGWEASYDLPAGVASMLMNQ